MREGKLSQAALDRSVIRVIKNKTESTITGSHIGGDFSSVMTKQKDVAILASRSVVVKEMPDLKFCFCHLLNHISCGKCVPDGIMVSIVFPEKEQEEFLKELMKSLDFMCTENNLQIIGGSTTVSKNVDYPVVSLTCIGFSIDNTDTKVVPEQDIVIINHVGVEGTLRAVSKYREKLLEKLPAGLLGETDRFSKELCAAEEIYLAYEAGATCVHTVGEGGIFAGLWEFAYEGKVGINVDLKKIPIYQETVEICELLEVNPYEFMSTGAVIVTIDNGKELCRKLREKGVEAVVCGRTNASNDRVITNEDEVRHLVPAQQDYIYKI